MARYFLGLSCAEIRESWLYVRRYLMKFCLHMSTGCQRELTDATIAASPYIVRSSHLQDEPKDRWERDDGSLDENGSC